MHSHTVMIRARAETRDALRELSEANGATLIETLDRLVSDAREASMLDALAHSLASDADAISAETKALDTVGADGLNPVDDFSDW